ncbi:SipW-dependent-type signal peptide-containing protein [Brachybacterium sp. YJGR34]|uniref:SipW-dependent-type signal peptide-containing protein n=1 Tax=Brachybacterium sp. YJGR34 TaxID=2059911 RepID=UPI000E0A3337|nr:SipW-dependent-type signal peptide-containing protein [Brachybacterium sp. YJGR34]
MSTATTNSTRRGRKIRALLAGGLVLGVGAAVTLAAWTDEEWAIGTFGAGSFNVEGSTDGTTFADHTSADGAAELAFDLEAAENLTPDDVVAAPFVLRLDADTSYDAVVELTDVSGAGANAANLTYGIITVPSAAECTAAATGTEIVPAGTGLDAGTGTFDLTAGTEGAAGDEVTLCFRVTAGPDLVQGESGTATWGFTATSAE